MKRWAQKLIYNFVVKYVVALNDEQHDRFLARVHRPEWVRKRQLPKAGGKTMLFYRPPKILCGYQMSCADREGGFMACNLPSGHAGFHSHTFPMQHYREHF